LLGIELCRKLLPGLPNVAVFDTSFHQTMPAHAYRYAVPQEWFAKHDVRKYGFHGTSHRFVSAEACRVIGREPGDAHLIVAHLGNGCSATAVRDGKSVDTTMGLTPLEGLMMGTRSGDLDPAVVAYMADRLGKDAKAVVDVLNKQSGLQGVSGVSNDMRTLLKARDEGSEGAALAVEMFCFRLAKAIASLAVSLERIDCLAFTGGIGENSVPVRARTIHYLGALGFRLDEAANQVNGRTTNGRITVEGWMLGLVVPTNEELLIARDTAALIG
jgi:acetate kinase